MDPEAHIRVDGEIVRNPHYNPLWVAHPLGSLVGSTELVSNEMNALEKGEITIDQLTGNEVPNA